MLLTNMQPNMTHLFKSFSSLKHWQSIGNLESLLADAVEISESSLESTPYIHDYKGMYRGQL